MVFALSRVINSTWYVLTVDENLSIRSYCFLSDVHCENETILFPLKPLSKLTRSKDVHFTRNLHNFVYDGTDA